MDGERLRLGVVGCGAAFESFHSPALTSSSDWELAAACDLSAERRAWARRDHPNTPVCESPAALLADTSLDALLVATPPETHAGLALEALRAGLHILVEKPLATRLPDARRLVDAAEAAGTILRVGFNRRFRNGYLEARDELAESSARVREVRHVFAAEERWRTEGAPAPLDILLHDVACHQIDLVAWTTGSTVREARARPFEDDGGAGVRLTLRLGEDLLAHCTASYSRRYVERLELDLPGGTLVVRPGGLTRGRWSGPWGERSDRLRQAVDHTAGRWLGRPTRTLRSFQRQLEAFAEAVRGAPTAGADVHDGFRGVAVVESCLESLADGGRWKPVEAEQALIAR